MVDHGHGLNGRRPIHGHAATGVRGVRVTAASAAQELTRWADGLAETLRTEIGEAERRGVISVGEGEQLLARLVVVLDQAVSFPWKS